MTVQRSGLPAIAAFACASAALLLPAPASAQSGAAWTDEVGRMMTLGFGGPEPLAPALDRTPAEMAKLFKSVCVDTRADAQATAAAAQVAGLEARPFTIPATKKVPATELQIWGGMGLRVSRTDGFFAAKQQQRNALFYLPALPDRAALHAALGDVLGAPTNAADALRKDGKPNKGYAPEWKLAADGRQWTIGAALSGDSRYSPGNRVQLSLRDTSGKGD